MGLDTTHDCWHGAYSVFMRWRRMIARIAGLPPLELMEGFFTYSVIKNSLERTRSENSIITNWLHSVNDSLPIKWAALKPNPLHELLQHSDCEGEIPWENCNVIADSLEQLMPALPPNENAGGYTDFWKDTTQQFIDGLRLAASIKENVEFH